ncbi:hypothetical protein [Uliginosibacterium gangwonense]|nr:hypothetical protein [Uliginosibacterium gangwonense]
MRIVLNPRQQLHSPEYEFFRGRKVPCFENPTRFEVVWLAIQAKNLFTII